MIQKLHYSDANFNAQIEDLLDRKIERNDQIEQSAAEIVAAIQAKGDPALLELTNKFDQRNCASVSDLVVPAEEMERLAHTISDDLYDALQQAAARITHFHEQEVASSWSFVEESGTELGQRITPLARAGIYVPGGKAAYPSSVLMTALPARVAGVEEIIMTVPAPDGELNPAVMAAAKICKVDRIFSVGGAQAVAALAYGTDTIPAVDKIVGPGNAYVAAAKKLVFGAVGIDMIAGPSEVLVICDDSAEPNWVAMDLFAQAEHDELAQAIAITDSVMMVEKIQSAIDGLLPTMERKEIIDKSLSAQGAIILVRDMDEAAELSDRIAPEHLELMVDDVDGLLAKVRHAGAIFAGKYSAEALGDYCAGPNHVLPTSGTARFSSPLGVYDFQKRTSVIRVSEKGSREIAGIAALLASSEGLAAHENSARLRNGSYTPSYDETTSSV